MSQVKLISIDTVPTADPYNNNEPTYAEISLDCRTGKLWITQECKTNSTTVDRWHGHERGWRIQGTINEDSAKELIDSNMEAFQTIVDGYDEHWNGSNFVAHFSDKARQEIDRIEYELNDALYEDFLIWSVGDWCEGLRSEISTQTTDDEIRELVESCEEPDSIVLDDPVEFLINYRNELIAEDNE